MAPDLGSPSLLGIAEFIVPTGSFFHAQTRVSSHIMEELSPKVRMIPDLLIMSKRDTASFSVT